MKLITLDRSILMCPIDYRCRY